jgi:hypothetical protein
MACERARDRTLLLSLGLFGAPAEALRPAAREKGVNGAREPAAGTCETDLASR